MAINGCPICLRKQRRIDELEEENERLREKLRVQRRGEEEAFSDHRRRPLESR